MELFALAVAAFVIGVGLIGFGIGIFAGMWRAGSRLRPEAGSAIGSFLVGFWSLPFGVAALLVSWIAARDVPKIDWFYGGLYVASMVGPVATHWLLREYPMRVDSALASLRDFRDKGAELGQLVIEDQSPAHTVIRTALAVEREPTASDAASYRAAPTDEYADRVRAAVARSRASELRRAILAGIPTLAPAVGVAVLLPLRVPINGFFTWLLYGCAALGALGLWVAIFTVRRICVAADGIERILLEA